MLNYHFPTLTPIFELFSSTRNSTNVLLYSEATSEGHMAWTPTLSKGVWRSLSRSLSWTSDQVMGRTPSLLTSDLAPVVLVTAAGFEPATPIGRRMTYHCTKWPDGRTFVGGSLPSTFSRWRTPHIPPQDASRSIPVLDAWEGRCLSCLLTRQRRSDQLTWGWGLPF